jgi:hypothetical protein
MVYFTLEVLTEDLNMYQKASTYDRRSQLIIITGSVVLLASIVSILVVRSNLSIKWYHPTTSLSPWTFLLCKVMAEIARRNTQNELVAAQEKSYFSFNFNCFSQRKAGKVYNFISEGNSILWFLKHGSKYLEIWDKITYRAHVCKFSSTDGLNRKLQIPFCRLLRPRYDNVTLIPLVLQSGLRIGPIQRMGVN